MLLSTTIDSLKEVIKDSRIDIKKFDFRYDDFPIKLDRISYTTYSINLINTPLSFIVYITPTAIIQGYRIRVNKERAIISKPFPIEPGLEYDTISLSEVRERFEFWINKNVLDYLKQNNLMNYSASNEGMRLGLISNKTVLLHDFKKELLISIGNCILKNSLPISKDDFHFEVEPIMIWDGDVKKYFGVHKLRYKSEPVSFSILIDENSNQNFKLTYALFNSNFSEIPITNEMSFRELTQLFNVWLSNDFKHYIRYKTEPDPFSDITNSDLFNSEKEDEILTQEEILKLNIKLDEIKEYVNQDTNNSTALVLYEDKIQREKINKDVDILIEIVETKNLPRKHLANLIKSTFENWSVNEKYKNLWQMFVKWISN